MKQALVVSILALVMIGCAATQEQQRPPSMLSPFGGSDPDKYPVVIMQTNMGPIIIKLDAVRAPVTVKNFLSYVEAGFYTNTVFHRVIPGFMIQGGGYEAGTIRQKSTNAPIVNEASNGYRNSRGTIAMARTRDLNSATSQFYINLVDNDNLDDAKYAVFGEVTMGMETVDKIAAVPTRIMGDHQNYPTQEIIIQSVIINK